MYWCTFSWNPNSPAGWRPVKRIANQARKTTTSAAISTKSATIAAGIINNVRKKFVSRLAFATSTAVDPQILLLDEVMAGLNPQEILDIIAIIRQIRDSGVTILLIEHVMHAVMSLSEHIHVLSYGKIIAQGTPREIVNNRDVVEAYLGRGAADHMSTAEQQGVQHA